MIDTTKMDSEQLKLLALIIKAVENAPLTAIGQRMRLSNLKHK